MTDAELAALEKQVAKWGPIAAQRLMAEVRRMRAALAASEAKTAAEFKIATGYHSRWMDADARAKAAEAGESAAREEAEKLAEVLRSIADADPDAPEVESWKWLARKFMAEARAALAAWKASAPPTKEADRA